MRVEFIGGPRDGEVHDLPDEQRYWRILLRELPDKGCTIVQDYVPSMLAALRCGIYAPVGNPREFVWQGDESDYWNRTGRPR